MIKPNKYTDPENSVITIGATIIKCFNKDSKLTYPDLLKKVKQTSKSKKIGENFVLALSLLYSIGRITYHRESDSFTFVKL